MREAQRRKLKYFQADLFHCHETYLFLMSLLMLEAELQQNISTPANFIDKNISF